MKAIVHKQYGPPEVASLQLIDIPQPKAKEVRIRVHATTVNRTDCGFRSAEYFVSRFFSGLLRPIRHTLGSEFAGEVDAVGSEVTMFKPGDRVYGFDDALFGGHAQYMVLPETAAMDIIPEGISYAEAAPITEGSHYALCNIRAAKVSEGQHVLVYGATGAIGSAAVQLLKYFGAHVTAVANTKNLALVKSLGADVVIDYQNQDFTAHPQRYDLAFDAVGKSSFTQCKPLLKPHGVYISTELGKRGDNIWRALAAPLLGNKKVLFPIPLTQKSDITFLGKLAAEGHFKPVIDRTYTLDEVTEAYRYAESGQKTGNLVILVP